MIRVKSDLNDDIRRFVLPESANFDILLAHIRSMYDINYFTIKYKDEDGDLVTIATDEELKEAISWTDKSGMLRISVFKNDPTRGVQVSPSNECGGESASLSHAADDMNEPSAVPEPIVSSTQKPDNGEETDAGASRSSGGAPRANDSRRTENHRERTAEELLDNLVRITVHILGGHSRGDTSRNDESTSGTEEASTSEVPGATLGFGSMGNEVRQLQKVLTNLGYMTAADYRIRSGVYGPRTANAVARFRMECGLGYGGYDEAASGALRLLVKTGVPATMTTGGEPRSTGATCGTVEKTESA